MLALKWEQSTRDRWRAVLPHGVELHVERSRSWRRLHLTTPWRVSGFGNYFILRGEEFATPEEAMVRAEALLVTVVSALGQTGASVLVVTAAPRPIQTDLWKLLDLLRLTDEERGMHGAMVREWIFERVDRSISKEEIEQYVARTLDAQFQAVLVREGLSLAQWKAKWEAANPGRKWDDAVAEDGEEKHMTRQVTELVDLMREEHRFEQERCRRTKKRNTP
jgi:hypothetical protein